MGVGGSFLLPVEERVHVMYVMVPYMSCVITRAKGSAAGL